MPGITGILTKHVVGNERQRLDKMLKCMLHEPFYTHGTYIQGQEGPFVGFVSLENSFSACMPVHNEDESITLFMTGECYSDKEVLYDLKSKGHAVKNLDDCSYLVHLYEERGDSFFEDLNGWYSGLIVDRRKQATILFNDRYAMKRIYYHMGANGFVFSSEAKSLLKAYPSLRRISAESVGEYLEYDCVLENRTFFPEISLLPPGSCWKFKDGELQKKRYHDSSILENQEPLTKTQFFPELKDTFKRILPRYFRGEGIGLSLTGGLDTRSILACLNPEPETLPCYTFGGTYRDIFDVRLAPKVARACNQRHYVIRMDDRQYLQEYPDLLERCIYLTDGIGSVVNVDMMIFNTLARLVSPVRMTGKYGSQVLKNVLGFQERAPQKELIDNDFHVFLTKAKYTCESLKRSHGLTFLLENELPWWWNGILQIESAQVDVRSPYLDNDLISVLYRAPGRGMDFGAGLQLSLIRENNPVLLRIPTTGGYVEGCSALRRKLSKVFINASSILDKIYIREAIPHRATHIVGKFDHISSPLHLQKLVMGLSDFRRYRVWFRDQLSGFLRETLLNQRTCSRPYWNRKWLHKLVERHIHGRGTYLREIRKVLQIEMIHRVLLEDIGAADTAVQNVVRLSDRLARFQRSEEVAGVAGRFRKAVGMGK